MRTRAEGAGSQGEAAELDGIERRLAWILGSSRTGSTWLLRMLVHPWRLAPEAPGVTASAEDTRPGPPIVPVNETYVSSHLSPLVTVNEGQGQEEHVFLHGMKGERPSYFLSRRYESVWRADFRRLVLRRLAAQADDAAHVLGIGEPPSIVVKEPNGSEGAQLLMSLLPRSRLIFLIRDGRDVVDSQLALRLHDGVWRRRHRRHSAVAGDEQRLSFVRARAKRWVFLMDVVQAAYDAHPPELRYRIRYEDLVMNPADELGALLDWLGRPRPDEAVRETVAAHSFAAIPEDRRGPGKARRAATPGLWRTSLTTPEQEAIEEIAGEKVRELGYEPGARRGSRLSAVTPRMKPARPSA